MKTNYFDVNTNTGDPVTPIETQQISPAAGSVLHKNNSNEYSIGYCVSSSAHPGTTTDYQIESTIPCQYYEQQGVSNPYCNSLPWTNDVNYNCSSYWSRDLETTILDNDQGISTSSSRQMHWLNGGYFYGMEEYRKYIYKELGTIHFSTSVKYDVVPNDSPFNDTSMDKIDYIKQFYVPDREFRILYPYELNESFVQLYFNSPSIFYIGNAFRSLEIEYLLNQIPIVSLKPTIKYSSSENKYISIFEEEPLFINNGGSFPIANTAIQSTKASISEENDGVSVMLSNGNMTYFPLLNENIKSQFNHRKSFVVSGIKSFPSCNNIAPEKFYYDFITKTKNVFDQTDTLVGSIENTTFNSYFINNSYRTPFTFYTSSISLGDVNTVYNNYKFICKIIEKNQGGTIKYVIVIDELTLNVIDSYNEISTVRGDNLLFGIINYMSSTFSYPLIATLFNYNINATGNKITLIKTGSQLLNHNYITNFYLESGVGLVIELNTDNDLKNQYISNTPNTKYALMLKCSMPIVSYVSNSVNGEGVVIKDADKLYCISGSEKQFLESDLFDVRSAKLSTPDYTSINSGNNNIPLRGSEYTNNEKDSYPIIRYVRKIDGKFYIQVLAGAFPYYHSLPHYPVVKKLTAPSTPTIVETSLQKVCSQELDWYNHVASTKWVCYIKHTEFGQDPTEYTSTENTKGAPATGPIKSVGDKPPPKRINNTIIYSGGEIVTGGQTVIRPGRELAEGEFGQERAVE